MKSINEIGVVDALYGSLDKISDQEFGQRISSIMDEQPYLIGFIFNLEEDFSEEEHQNLIKATIVIRDVFVTAGMPMNMVVSSDIDSVVEEEVDRFNKLEGEGIVSIKDLIEGSSSPSLLEAVLKKMNMKPESTSDTGLIVSVLIRLMEEAAGAEKKDDE